MSLVVTSMRRHCLVDSNRTRKDFVADEVLKRVSELVYSGVKAPVVGVYRLTMKTGSDKVPSRILRTFPTAS